MRRYIFILIILFLRTIVCHCDVIDSFQDGNFTANPSWSGAVGAWQVVQDSDCSAGAANSRTLRLNVDSGSGSVFLSTAGPADWGTSQSWSFWLGRRDQSATSSNCSMVWLWANEVNFTSSTVDGYRIRFGDNSGGDEICLERVQDGVTTVVLASDGAVTNGLTDIGFLVRVTRKSNSEWNLYTSPLPGASGEGAVASALPSKINTPVHQGQATDATFKNFTGGYVGVMASFSSGASARSGAEFDQFFFDQSSDASLPVQLFSFAAIPSHSVVLIQWVTQSEIDNLGFYVMRAAAGNDFSVISQFISGAGTSSDKHDYHYVDDRVTPGTFRYQLKQVDINGTSKIYGPIEVTVQSENSDEPEYPFMDRLEMNYPNPFNPRTTIALTIGSCVDTFTTICIYDILGREISLLLKNYLAPGTHKVLWSGEKHDGTEAPSGVYFCRMETGAGHVSTLKLLKME